MMKCSVFIESNVIDDEDLWELNEQNGEICYSTVRSDETLLKPGTVQLLVELSCNLPYDEIRLLLTEALTGAANLALQKEDASHVHFEVYMGNNDTSFSGLMVEEKYRTETVKKAVDTLLFS